MPWHTEILAKLNNCAFQEILRQNYTKSLLDNCSATSMVGDISSGLKKAFKSLIFQPCFAKFAQNGKCQTIRK
jgi:hypothetical protein